MLREILYAGSTARSQVIQSRSGYRLDVLRSGKRGGRGRINPGVTGRQGKPGGNEPVPLVSLGTAQLGDRLGS